MTDLHPTIYLHTELKRLYPQFTNTVVVGLDADHPEPVRFSVNKDDRHITATVKTTLTKDQANSVVNFLGDDHT